MGIVFSTFAPTAFRLAYICQKLFDPKYNCIEDVQTAASCSPEVSAADSTQQQQHQVQSSHASKAELLSLAKQPTQESSLLPSLESRMHNVKSNSLPRYNSRTPAEYNNSLHQQNRNRRARQLRFKTRPSSFDGTLIIRAKTKSAVIVSSSPSPLSRHWDVTSSSSGCSSDSNSNTDSDSETELRVSTNASNEEIGSAAKLAMTAEEEEAFRVTLGRGHFTRSKKDRFLNNLRLQKQSIYNQLQHPSSTASLW